MRNFVGAMFSTMLWSSAASADWGIDFVRFQCIPEIGQIQIETFYVDNPDNFGFFGASASDKDQHNKRVRNFEDKHHLYVAGKQRKFECTLGTVSVEVQFDYGTNSQGQPVGSVTISGDGKPLIKGLPIAAYRPDIGTLTIMAARPYPGNSQVYDLYASLVIYSADTKKIEHQTKLGDKVLDRQWLYELANKSGK